MASMDRGRRFEEDDRDDRDRGRDFEREGGDRERERERSPPPRRDRTRSPSPRRNEEDSEEVRNPGNNLYVSGLSSRTTDRDLEDHFNKEGTVADCRLVVDPRSKESRGFAFVMMDSRDSAVRCVKYLDRSVLQGRVITVALAKRKRPRTPTPGRFLGVRPLREMVPPPRDPYGGGGGGGGGGGDRRPMDPYAREPYPVRRSSPDYAPYRRNRSPDYGPYRGNDYYR